MLFGRWQGLQTTIIRRLRLQLIRQSNKITHLRVKSLLHEFLMLVNPLPFLMLAFLYHLVEVVEVFGVDFANYFVLADGLHIVYYFIFI